MHLDRLIAVIEAIAAAGRPLSASQVHAATRLPRPTCYRLLRTLTEHRLLDDPDGDARYQVGKRLVRLALLSRSDLDMQRAAAATMKEAAIELGETVFLSRLRHETVEIIHVETPTDPRRAYVHPGLGRRPMHACSCSKVIAAFADGDVQESVLSGRLKNYTVHTKTSRARLRKEFSTIRHRGYAECVEEVEVGVSSVAAPISLADAAPVLSIGAVGPVRRFTASHRARLGNELIGLSTRISAGMLLADDA